MLLASGKNSAQMMQHFSKIAQSSTGESFKMIQHGYVGGGGNHIHARMTLHGLNRSGHPACSVPSALPTLHRFYECRYADDNHRWSRYFTNLLYPNRMPLGFFTVSSPGESMTLSLVTLAQYYPSEISIFDAKPLISEVVTLSLLCFSSANHLLSQSRRRILNVTESDIS